MRIADLRVPEIGGFAKVIRVLVKSGDAVTEYAPILTLETETGTFEVPARFAGTVRDVKARLGDTVTEGTAIASIWVPDSATSRRPSGADADDEDEAVTTQPRRSSAKNPLRVAIVVAALGFSLLAWVPAAWQRSQLGFFAGDSGTGAISMPAPSPLGWEIAVVTLATVAWILAGLVKSKAK